MELGSLNAKIRNYKQVLENTDNYRKSWHESVKPMLVTHLQAILTEAELPKAMVIERNNIENLESVVLDLGRTSSGITENMEDTGVKRTMIKSNGSLIYQQLFNGKIMIMIISPHIEGYGEPKPPMTLEILRPEELKPPFILRHMEAFLRDITEWEDYDDDQPSKSSQSFNPIGFKQESEDDY